MTRALILLQGVPGSGKSTIANGLRRADYRGEVGIVSTDYFWYRLGGFGKYAFDYERLEEAHKWAQENADLYMRNGMEVVIIDNTNIKRAHAQPYLDLAAKYGYPVQVVRVTCPIGLAISRNIHNVPEEVIRRMAEEMEDLL